MLRRMTFLTIMLTLVLIFCFIVFAKSAEKITAYVSGEVENGEITVFSVDGNKCIGLKDVAIILKDTEDKFDFKVEDNTVVIKYGENYSGDLNLISIEKKEPGYSSLYMNFQIGRKSEEINVYEIENEYFLMIDDLHKIINCEISVDSENSKVYINKKIEGLGDISIDIESSGGIGRIFDSKYIGNVREKVKQIFFDVYGEKSFSTAIQEKLNSEELCHSFELLENGIRLELFTKEVIVPYSEISEFFSFDIKNYAIISMFFGESEDMGFWNTNIVVESVAVKSLSRCPYTKNKGKLPVIDPSRPVIALTFDDGPKNGTTERILDVLEKYDARATFFVVGTMVEKAPELVKREYDLGCQIGNHSYSHPILTKLKLEEANEEVSKTSNLVFDITGDYARIARPPYGSLSHEIKEASGVEWFNWSIDTYDWKTRNADSVYKNIMNNVSDGDVILMHDLYGSTVDAVEKVVPELAEKGFQMVTMKELIELKGGASNISGHIKK